MGTNGRYWAPIVWALGQGSSEALAAGSESESPDGWRDPYALILPYPETYRLAPLLGDSSPSITKKMHSQGLDNQPFQRQIARAANEFKVDPALVHAVIRVESGYNASALSPKGAQGLMQLLPETAKRFGVATADLLWKPDHNIRAGVAYLRSLLDLFGQDLHLVLAAYNAGENAVLRYGRQIPPFPETRDYVPKVLAIYTRLQPPAEQESTATPSERVRIQYPAPLPEAQPDGPTR